MPHWPGGGTKYSTGPRGPIQVRGFRLAAAPFGWRLAAGAPRRAGVSEPETLAYHGQAFTEGFTAMPMETAPTSRLARLAAQLDSLNEFEREPVTPDKLQGGRQFAAMFGGEHVAGTEFVIGSMFVLWGVSAKDLLLGLLVGNLLAVLSWTFICAPIATQVRLTLYWYLRRIAGPGLGVLYNVANAILFCFLAGSMIALCADAVATGLHMAGVPFSRPTLNDLAP